MEGASFSPKGHAALSRYTHVKAPALPEVADMCPKSLLMLDEYETRGPPSRRHERCLLSLAETVITGHSES